MMEMIVPRALDKWKRVGTALGLSERLIAIEKERRGDCHDCYLEVFTLWKDKGEPPFTWDTILHVLMNPNVNLCMLATHIIEKITRQRQ